MSLRVEIEHGVPIPEVRRGCWRRTWAEMKAGDSFTVAENNERNAALMAGKRMGLSVESVKLNGDGWRLWLVKGKNGDNRPRS